MFDTIDVRGRWEANAAVGRDPAADECVGTWSHVAAARIEGGEKFGSVTDHESDIVYDPLSHWVHLPQ